MYKNTSLVDMLQSQDNNTLKIRDMAAGDVIRFDCMLLGEE